MLKKRLSIFVAWCSKFNVIPRFREKSSLARISRNKTLKLSVKIERERSSPVVPSDPNNYFVKNGYLYREPLVASLFHFPRCFMIHGLPMESVYTAFRLVQTSLASSFSSRGVFLSLPSFFIPLARRLFLPASPPTDRINSREIFNIWEPSTL